MTVDREKIRQKLQFMRRNLRDLDIFNKMDIEEFRSNSINEAAAIRMLQVTIEAMLDICAHVIAREGLGLPKSYGEIIQIAVQYGLIPSDKIETYQKMVRFRNRVVHLYDDVDAKEIYFIIHSRLNDFKPFMATTIKRYLDR